MRLLIVLVGSETVVGQGDLQQQRCVRLLGTNGGLLLVDWSDETVTVSVRDSDSAGS